ncbi:MAG: hypothetical protein RDU24_01520 [Humidesulfovibrio sp.]|uniref:hypothetical protein n=1 Tax=Humidesulfovibrio sp. TaxID=2910988 RepID=UPI0027F5581E|nr:hypothetical protein [Humidesulfovibrio sp.]MDQ7834038.1 hypothetical protein [Humidesulfovibrio sp.]
MDRHKTLADALESEVLTEMADTFFGKRKALEDLIEDFKLLVEDIKAREAKVFSRVFFLRSLLLGQEGEAELFAALGLEDPFNGSMLHPGSRTWQPERVAFAFFVSTRFEKAVLQAYSEVRRTCEVYMNGEYEEDPDRSGRKRLSPHYRQIQRHCARLNERIDKVNTEMSPSSVLQYARSISAEDQPGHGTLSNSLGAESLDNGLMFPKIDFVSLGLWKAPNLPPVESCGPAIRSFCQGYYKRNSTQIKKVLSDLS